MLDNEFEGEASGVVQEVVVASLAGVVVEVAEDNWKAAHNQHEQAYRNKEEVEAEKSVGMLDFEVAYELLAEYKQELQAVSWQVIEDHCRVNLSLKHLARSLLHYHVPGCCQT